MRKLINCGLEFHRYFWAETESWNYENVAEMSFYECDSKENIQLEMESFRKFFSFFWLSSSSLRWQIPLFWWWKKVGNSPGRSQPIVKISKPQPLLPLSTHVNKIQSAFASKEKGLGFLRVLNPNFHSLRIPLRNIAAPRWTSKIEYFLRITLIETHFDHMFIISRFCLKSEISMKF